MRSAQSSWFSRRKYDLIFGFVIFISIIAITISVISLLETREAEVTGTLYVSLVDENNVEIDFREIEFHKDETLREVLESEYELVVIEYSFGAMIVSIGDLEPTEVNHFIEIYINHSLSPVGIDGIVPVDNIIITFKIATYVPTE